MERITLGSRFPNSSNTTSGTAKMVTKPTTSSQPGSDGPARERIVVVGDHELVTIVGGGDTDVAVHMAGESNNISYISTGGGAFLYLMEGKTLPGVAALTDK